MLLDALVVELAARRLQRLVLESRSTADHLDRSTLLRRIEADERLERLAYDHLRPHEEPLLWVADAVAWSYTRGDEWRERLAPLPIRRIGP